MRSVLCGMLLSWYFWAGLGLPRVAFGLTVLLTPSFFLPVHRGIKRFQRFFVLRQHQT